MTCPKCKYEWTPKTKQPKRCPRCGKWLIAKLVAFLAMVALTTSACQKHPDSPVQVAASPVPPTTTVTTTPPPPPPVSACQGATVPVTIPTYVQNNDTSQPSVIPGFDVGCGDTVQVLIKNIMLAPSDPWTTLTSDTNASSFYTISGQTITVNVHTGNTLYVQISAILH